MDHDFLKELEYLGVTARMKRLSDVLSTNIKDLYITNGLDIEPSWHLIFLYLAKHHTATMSQIATSLNISQPAMTKMINRMMNKGYLNLVKNKSDNRKKNIGLTPKAIAQMPQFQRIWDVGEQAIREILANNSQLFTHLEHLEDQLMTRSFKDRAMSFLNTTEQEEHS